MLDDANKNLVAQLLSEGVGVSDALDIIERMEYFEDNESYVLNTFEGEEIVRPLRGFDDNEFYDEDDLGIPDTV